MDILGFKKKYHDKRREDINKLNNDKINAANIVQGFFDNIVDKKRLMNGMSKLFKSLYPDYLEENILYYEKMLNKNHGFNLNLIDKENIVANILLKFVEEKTGLKYTKENYQLLNLISIMTNIQFFKNTKMYYVNEFKI